MSKTQYDANIKLKDVINDVKLKYELFGDINIQNNSNSICASFVYKKNNDIYEIIYYWTTYPELYKIF